MTGLTFPRHWRTTYEFAYHDLSERGCRPPRDSGTCRGLPALRRSSRCRWPNGIVHCGRALRRVHEPQRPQADVVCRTSAVRQLNGGPGHLVTEGDQRRVCSLSTVPEPSREG